MSDDRARTAALFAALMVTSMVVPFVGMAGTTTAQTRGVEQTVGPSADTGAWPMFAGGPENGGATEGSGPAAPTEAWTLETGGEVRGGAAVADGTVYVGSSDAAVSAVDAATGEREWTAELGGEIRASPAVVGDTVYAVSTNSVVYALNVSDGDRRWATATGQSLAGPPTVANGRLYVGGEQGTFHAIETADGSFAWNRSFSGPLRGAPAVRDGTLYVGTPDGLFALDASDGSNRWVETVAGSAAASPTVTGDTVYTNTVAGVVAVGVDGERRWSHRADGPVYGSPAVADGTVYVGTLGNNVTALHAGNGSVDWHHRMAFGIQSSPALGDGTVYVGGNDDNVTALGAASGERRWTYTTGDDVVAPPALANGRLYVGSLDGSVYALGAGTVEFDGDAAFRTRSTSLEAGDDVVFDARATTGEVADYEWAFGDGSRADAASSRVFHAYTEPGEYDVTLRVVGPNGGTDSTTRTITVGPRDTTGPDIESVTPELSGTKLAGLSFENNYTADISSSEPIERVTFELGDTVKTDTDGTDGWERALDMGVLDGDTVLNVTAVDAEGQRDTYTSRVAVRGVPDWLETLVAQGGVEIDEANGTIAITRQVPDPPIDASVDVPGSIPVVGGEQEFKLRSRFGVLYNAPDREATLLGQGTLGLTVAGYDAKGTVGARGTVDTETWQLKRAKLWVGASVELWSTSYDIPSYPGVPADAAFDVGIAPKTRTEIFLESGPNGILPRRGAVEPGVTATGELAVETPAPSLTGTLSGDLTGHYEVPPPIAPGATVSLSGTVSAEFAGMVEDWEPLDFDQGFGSQVGEGDDTFSAQSDGGWRPAPKYGGVPGADGGGLGALSGSVGVASDTASGTRITADRVADRSPTAAYDASDGNYRVVWSKHTPTAPAEKGRDLFTAVGTGTDWSDPVRVTDSAAADIDPVLATAPDGRSVLVWTRVETDLENASSMGAVYNSTETFYAVHDGGEWSEPRPLGSNDLPDVAPDVAYSPANGDWRVAWRHDGDGNLSTDVDAEVRHAAVTQMSNGDYGTADPQTIANATRPVVAGQGSEPGHTLAFFAPDAGPGDNGTVLQVTVAGDGTGRGQYDAPATDLTDIATGPDSLAWVEGPVSDPTLHYAAGGVQETVPLGNTTAVRGLSLRSLGGDTRLLTYRGKTRGSETLRYTLRRGGEWGPSRALTDNASNLTYWQASTAVGDDEFVAAFAGKQLGTDQNHDLFSARHRFRPDLALDAEAVRPGGAPNGTNETNASLAITVSNPGDGPVVRGVPVTVSRPAFDGTTEEVFNRSFGSLDTGETTTRTVEVPSSPTGAYTVRVDPNDRVAELTNENNERRVWAPKPDLAVRSVNATRVTAGANATGQNATVRAVVENTASVITGGDYRVVQNGTTLANGTILGLGPADESGVSSGLNDTTVVNATVPASAVAAANVTEVVVTPAGPDATPADNRWRGRLLRPDLSVSGDAVRYNRTGTGLALDTVVKNDGESAANATLTALHDDVPVGSTNITVPAAVRNASAYVPANLTLAGVDANDSLSLVVSTPYDTNGANDVVRERVPADVPETPVRVGVEPVREAPLVAGESFVANVTVDANGNSVYGVQTALRYDAANLTVENVSRGAFLGSDGAAVRVYEAAANGSLARFAATREGTDAGATGSGTVAQVRFRVDDAYTGGTLGIGVANAELADPAAEALAVTRANASLSPRPVSLSVTAPDEVGEGETFRAAVRLDSRGWSAHSVQADLRYDRSLLTVANVTPGDALGDAQVFENVTAEAVRYGATRTNDTGTAANATLFEVAFRVNDSLTADARAGLSLSGAVVLDAERRSLPVVEANASTTVDANDPPRLSLSLRSTVNNAGAPVLLGVNASDPDGTLAALRASRDGEGLLNRSCGNCSTTLTPTPENATWTGEGYAATNYTVAVTDDEGETVRRTVTTTVRAAGDATGDGAVDVFDAVVVGQGWNAERGDDSYTDAADLTNDGEVDITDSVVLGRNWESPPNATA